MINLEAAFEYLTQAGNVAIVPSNAVNLAVDSIVNLHLFLCQDTLSPTIAISNQGPSNIHSFMVRYRLDGIERTTSWVGDLKPNQQISLPLPGFLLSRGAHIFEVEVTTNQGVEENLLVDNRRETKFFSYPPDLPIVTTFDVCKEADGAVFAQSRGLGQVRWFGEGGEELGRGNRYWLS